MRANLIATASCILFLILAFTVDDWDLILLFGILGLGIGIGLPVVWFEYLDRRDDQ